MFFRISTLDRRLVVALLAFLVLPLIYMGLLHDLLVQIIERHHLWNLAESSTPRGAFYYGGFVLAAQHFPLGSGLGTFGSHAAVAFGSPVYHQLGFDAYRWFHAENPPLTDTFWPHVYGESGALGFLAMALALFFLARLMPNLQETARLFRSGMIPQSAFVSACAAWSGFVLLLINTLTAPNIYGLVYMLPLLMFLVRASKLKPGLLLLPAPGKAHGPDGVS
ncbi:MAG: hypothetical protein D6819_03970 [Gammaproteobacteria bacterium]|nr:MAG: hypothetical protein D6819_03970 [Gammaproteobacteria bacterium]